MLLKKLENGKVEIEKYNSEVLTIKKLKRKATEKSGLSENEEVLPHDASSSTKQMDPKLKLKKRVIAKKFAFSPISNLRKTSTEDHKLNGYSKKVILERLESGCNSEHFQNALKTLKVPTDVVQQYLNTHLKNTVVNMRDEVSYSNRIENENKWLEEFQKLEKDKLSNKFFAFIMNLIENSEIHPLPNELEGVNLASVYKFLSNALMGLPQKELDNRSMCFLINEYKELCNELNSSDSVSIRENMRGYLSSTELQVHNVSEVPFDSLILMNKMCNYINQLKD